MRKEIRKEIRRGKSREYKAGDKVIQGNADIIKKGGTDHGKCFRCKIYRSDQKDR